MIGLPSCCTDVFVRYLDCFADRSGRDGARLFCPVCKESIRVTVGLTNGQRLAWAERA